METALDPSTIEARLAEFFAAEAERQGIAAVYLFGSVAREKVGGAIDIGVGVLYEDDPSPAIDAALAGDLERLLGRTVHVKVLNQASPEAIHKILRDNYLLIDHNRSRRIAFEVQARNEYFDILPHLLRYREKNPPEASAHRASGEPGGK